MALEAISNAVSKTVEATVNNRISHIQKLVNSQESEITNTAYYINNNQKKGQTNLSEDQLKNAIDKANKQMRPHRTRFEFSYHEETKRVSITVRDRETSEVIKEIPPEQALEMLEKLWEIAGFLVDERR